MLVNLEHSGVLSCSGEGEESNISVEKGWIFLREREEAYLLNGSRVYPMNIPFLIGHRGLGKGEKRRENRVDTIKRTSMFCGMAEVDVQVTEDGVCILYHDDVMQGRKIDQWKHADLPEEVDKLKDLLLSTSIGLNIEIKYEDQPKHSVSQWCKYIMEEIQEVEKNLDMGAEKEPNSCSSSREMIFSSFSREVCVELKKYTKKVFLLLEHLTEEGIAFAVEHSMIGIVTEAKEILKNPHLIIEIRKASLLLLSYGDENNFISTISQQRLLGINAIISDEVQILSKFL
ncbi:glycerophosphodiester phosphodiesterase [Nematocida sp. LUAm3]|nr:glycerophosphodiester phosphodiesterase [Nematocida sp. LUAm3]KAI5173973.1 glycerophosphodiester phosphodiesterase [Nematocida sp. LUAm2]KAI5177282.1 glycerophosphodiester phosphodiesterase [Nematocida sp. LUAm1]